MFWNIYLYEGDSLLFLQIVTPIAPQESIPHQTRNYYDPLTSFISIIDLSLPDSIYVFVCLIHNLPNFSVSSFRSEVLLFNLLLYPNA